MKYSVFSWKTRAKMKIYICFIFLICILYFLIVETLNNNLFKEFYSLLGVFPIKVYKDLTRPAKFKIELHKVGGVYGLVNISDSTNIKQYIGSSKDLYQRLSDHLNGRDSNSRLQRSISKYGIEKFLSPRGSELCYFLYTWRPCCDINWYWNWSYKKFSFWRLV
jgi:hypothetical protein